LLLSFFFLHVPVTLSGSPLLTIDQENVDAFRSSKPSLLFNCPAVCGFSGSLNWFFSGFAKSTDIAIRMREEHIQCFFTVGPCTPPPSMLASWLALFLPAFLLPVRVKNLLPLSIAGRLEVR